MTWGTWIYHSPGKQASKFLPGSRKPGKFRTLCRRYNLREPSQQKVDDVEGPRGVDHNTHPGGPLTLVNFSRTRHKALTYTVPKQASLMPTGTTQNKFLKIFLLYFTSPGKVRRLHLLQSWPVLRQHLSAQSKLNILPESKFLLLLSVCQ